MLLSTPTVSYQNRIEGTWGRFASPAGEVAFLLTKARLGKQGTDPQRRLTAHLRPVREILESEALDFNQLLQRDLDDHRVATELIPYMLTTAGSGPAFFPPIVAVLLPFGGAKVAPTFPPANPPAVEASTYGADFELTRYGAAFEVGRLWDGKLQQPHELQLGRLSWNDEEAKLVVIDGQHRAMALLAVDRTLNLSWGGNAGAKYRHFYEHRVRRLLELEGTAVQLEQIEFPVTVCWFPNAANPHGAARKLFVDLNREARAPSEARLILLSDDDLTNIFARSLLNELRRTTDDLLPVYAVEYDNPDARTSTPVRWSVMTNLHLLRYAVLHTVFAESKYLDDMTAGFGGRPAWSDRNAFMRAALNLKSFMPETVDDDDRVYERSLIAHDYFPRSYLPQLRERFVESWGKAILHLLSDVMPYREHWKALTILGNDWARSGSIAELAYEALFSGVGMFWTLRDSDAYWRQQVQDARQAEQPVPTKPEIVKAWDALMAKKEEFELLRANRYLGSSSEGTVAASNEVYGFFVTHACQLGLVLTLSTLARDNNVSGTQLPALARRLSSVLNASLTAPLAQSTSRDRRTFLKRTGRHPFNRIPKLDTPMAVSFRYFWLELLCASPELHAMSEWLDIEQVAERRDEGRVAYLRLLENEQQKALRKANPEWTTPQLKAQPRTMR